MQHLRKVLVGVPTPMFSVDGTATVSPAVAAAIRQAVQLAATTSCTVTLLAVCGPVPSDAQSLDEANQRGDVQSQAEAEKALKKVAAEFNTAGLTIETRVVPGEAWQELCLAVLRDDFDLVIAAGSPESEQTSPTNDADAKLLRNCPCAVWIVKPADEEREDSTVLVATQLDENGQSALHLAIDGSELLDAFVKVLHVLEFESPSNMNSEQTEQHRAGVRTERLEALEAAIMRTDYRTTPHGVEPLVVEGQPSASILEAIAQHDVDLLVIGTGGSGSSAALVGKTAEHLIRHAPCSLLAVKPDGFVCPVVLEDVAQS